jgi:CRISPR/Cas system-associated exonuclease Cas4 (RecB family)
MNTNELFKDLEKIGNEVLQSSKIETKLPESPKIRASQMYMLFTDARKKGELSETTKTLCYQTIAREIGALKQWTSRYVEKGIIMEDESITFVNKILQTNYEKNYVSYDGGTIIGTPDIITDDEVIDIKNSFDIETHIKNITQDELHKQYYFQLQSYMLLTNKDKAKVLYVLMPTPDYLLEKQARALEYKYQDYDKALETLKLTNEVIASLPNEFRVFEYSIVRDENFLQQFNERYEPFKLFYQTTIKKLNLC